ncbi:MAG: glycosyltransferase [Bacteroidales bacterium]|nr:glycosyltransferase [Bacteroidales bacterium]
MLKNKLLQINVSVNFGSTGKIAEQIGQLAIDAGWESYIAYGRFYNSSSSYMIKIGTKLNVLWHVLLSRLFDYHGLASVIATKRLIRMIKQISPDIIHLHNIHGYYLNYKILFEYLNSTDIPLVWTLHDCWPFTGHCAHFVIADCYHWMEGGCGNCPLYKRYPLSMTDFSSRNYRIKKRLFTSNSNIHFVTVSKWLQDLLAQSFLKNSNSNVIYNGIDLQLFNKNTAKPVALTITENDKIILGVSSVWTASKGLDDFKKLRSKLPSNIKIILVGLKPEQIQELPDGIIGVERTQSAAHLAGYYTMANVFVNPTYADTFPTVNLEALACGTPVITYKTGGSPEAITAQTGYIVEQGDIDALCEAINYVLQKGKTHYEQPCRQRAEEYFDKTKCYQKYIELYKQILSHK